MNSTSYLPRTVKIDWLRIQIESFNCDFYRTLLRTVKLPFADIASASASGDSNDLEDNPADSFNNSETNQLKNSADILAFNKIWHRMWEFQGSKIGAYISNNSHVPSKFFVNLNASSLAFLDLQLIIALISISSEEYSFFCNRIDIALDFPVDGERLSLQPWEIFLHEKLIYSYRTVKRIHSSGGCRPGSTVYLGSRESESFVRFYEKYDSETDTDFDRWEVEFKRFKATWIAENLISSDRPLEFLHQCAVESVSLRYSSETAFFKKYKYAPGISVRSPRPSLDIERSIEFIERHGPTLAMIREYLGPDNFAEFIKNTLRTGKLKMKSRHFNTIAAAKFFTVFAAVFFGAIGLPSALAGSPGLCPANSGPPTLQSQMVQKFPIDIILPNQSEQAYLNQIGDGCFSINSGMDFDRVCLPGMIVRALQPLVVLGVGLRFIFSDG
jgi:hypothetical protein